jgi:polyisoprenoid-binding protein YceI
MTTFQIDPAHTDILFSAKHMMVTTVRGRFADVEGELTLDEADPRRSGGTVRVAAASLSSGAARRDDHLRSPDFFDAEQHPWITFAADAIEPRDDGSWAVRGDLTIREVTRPITFGAEFLGFYSSMAGARRVGLRARATLNRKDWGLGWNVALESGGWLVGEDVTVEVEIAAEEASVAPSGDRAREDAAA